MRCIWAAAGGIANVVHDGQPPAIALGKPAWVYMRWPLHSGHDINYLRFAKRKAACEALAGGRPASSGRQAGLQGAGKFRHAKSRHAESRRAMTILRRPPAH
jgi:hypothetical protein